MAITKTHPIKSTVNLAIEYICSPEKTDGKILISSYGCSPETADIEFEMTRDRTYSKRGTVLARHLIQSFEPNETTPEQAHEIGLRLADEVLGGKYEYVLSTHIDKGHIHNHIIFNAVSFTDLKKYHSNKRSYHEIQRISDNLCRDYGLSVIEPSGNKGKSYIEHKAERNGTSWKAQLRYAIDKYIVMADNFEEFLRLMERSGYKVKKRNKNVLFSADSKELYMSSKTLGYKYTVEAIIDRIAGRAVTFVPMNDKRIRQFIDLEYNSKGKGFEHWAKLNNLKQAAKTLNFLTQQNINTFAELKVAADNAAQKFDGISSQIKIIEKEINRTALLIKTIQTYSKFKPVYSEYKTAKDKTDFREKHRAELTLYEAAFKELKAAQFPKIKELKKTHSELVGKKKLLYGEYRAAKSSMTELQTAKSNIETLLKIDKQNIHEKNNSLE